MRHVVMWSSGITSAAVGKLVVDEHGRDDVVFLFADTLVEDPDNYRFNREATAALGMELTVVRDGRTPQQVNRDVRLLSNSRVAKCSELLKITPCRRWLETNCDPNDTVLYVGLDWTEDGTHPGSEKDRVTGNRERWRPWQAEFPLTQPPYHFKDHWLAEFRRLGVEPPNMYRRGYAHANCAGGCVRGGQAQWAHLARENPALFASWEEHEAEMNALTRQGKDAVSIVRDRRGGVTRPLPLSVIRRRVESQPTLIDWDDVGGCGCFTSDPAGEGGVPTP